MYCRVYTVVNATGFWTSNLADDFLRGRCVLKENLGYCSPAHLAPWAMTWISDCNCMRIDINIDYLSIINRSNQCAATSVQQRLHKKPEAYTGLNIWTTLDSFHSCAWQFQSCLERRQPVSPCYKTQHNTTQHNNNTTMAILAEVGSSILLYFLVFGMSATVDIRQLRKQLRNRNALLTGITLQFIVLPFLGFVVVKVLKLNAPMGITLLVVTSSPGGSYSNW